MTTAMSLLILIAPFVLAATLSWAAHRAHILRFRRDGFPVAGPMAGRFADDDRDALRIEHDLDAVRSRFEHHPSWPSSGATGERR
ncbi:MAG: hypothetical protein JST91_16650 [Actinobacteria bacterium]|nr:hypothetical protein [Actinomycetota bacterium]